MEHMQQTRNPSRFGKEGVDDLNCCHVVTLETHSAISHVLTPNPNCCTDRRNFKERKTPGISCLYPGLWPVPHEPVSMEIDPPNPKILLSQEALG